MNREKECILSFVSLKEFDEINRPIGRMASGCIVEYYGKKFLLTVFHAIGNLGRWGLEIRYDNKKKAVATYLLGGFTFLKQIDLKCLDISDVDFAIKEIETDIEPYYQEISPDGTVMFEIKKTIHNVNFDITPNTNQSYSFAGLTRPTKVKGREVDIIIQQITLEKDLKFVEARNEGDVYVFRLSHPYGDDTFYQGCSGAPIIDRDGNIVALVAEGRKDSDEIYGINLNRYKIVLDIETERIK